MASLLPRVARPAATSSSRLLYTNCLARTAAQAPTRTANATATAFSSSNPSGVSKPADFAISTVDGLMNSDCMILAGTLTNKMVPALRKFAGVLEHSSAKHTKGSSYQEKWISIKMRRSYMSGQVGRTQQMSQLLLESRLLIRQQEWIVSQARGLKAAPKLMEVILTADLNRVGKAGEIVKVAKGHARNKLIPQLLALPKLEKYVLLVQKQLKAIKSTQPEEEKIEDVQDSKTEEQKLKELNAVLARLETQRVVIRRHVREDTTLHEFVTVEDLVAEVRRQLKVQIQEINLEMGSELSTLGDYDIPMRLPKNVEVPGGKAKLLLKVRVRRK